MEEKSLKQLAEQLRKPSGEKGLEIAKMMSDTNLDMTLHSVKRLQLKKGNSILEIGHGEATHVKEVFKLEKEITYTGLDISELMHQKAQENNLDFIKQKKAFFYKYDGVAIPFSNYFFDRIFTVNTIYFWQNPSFFIQDLYRILKPKGILNITYGEKNFMKQLPFTQYGFTLYNLEDIQELIKHASFKMIASDTQREKVLSKTGQLVDRDFTTVSLQKRT